MTGRALVTGGGGFLGSHLCDRLLVEGHEVVCLDNFVTGARENIAHLENHPAFDLVEQDACMPFDPEGPLDLIFHLASPASPPQYLRRPIETLDVGSIGTRNLLVLAAKNRAKFLLASTSEVYGDPLVSPQPESYRGNVSPTGPRSVYDEAKRFAEALTSAFMRHEGVETRIARIFNTYGPRLTPGDGRAISNFVWQALDGSPVSVYGDGSQTRSFCYVDDLVDGLMRLMDSEVRDPVNLGNPDERTILEVAQLVVRTVGSTSEIVFRPLPEDDPIVRHPDITRARELLGWRPGISLDDGLAKTIAWFRAAGDTAHD